MISTCLGSLGCHNLEFVVAYVSDLLSFHLISPVIEILTFPNLILSPLFIFLKSEVTG